MCGAEDSSEAMITVRPVSDESELRRAFAFTASLVVAAVDAEDDVRLHWLLNHFPADRELMQVAVDGSGELRGGALGYRDDSGEAKLQILGVDSRLRRRGVGTRLVGAVEAVALRAGCTSVYLGAESGARPFYIAIGYSGRRDVLHKDLSGRALVGSADSRHERIAALRAARERRLAANS